LSSGDLHRGGTKPISFVRQVGSSFPPVTEKKLKKNMLGKILLHSKKCWVVST